MNSLWRSTATTLTLRYMLALTALGVLALLNYLLFRAEIRESESAAAILNVSGRQRTLLQHTALQAQELVTAIDPVQREQLRLRLRNTVKQLEAAHYRLIQFDSAAQGPSRSSPRNGGQQDGPRPQSTVEQIYFNAPWLLDIEVRNYVAQALALADSPPAELVPSNPHLRYIWDVALSNRVTQALEEVVTAYELEIDSKTADVRRLAYSSFLSTYVVLALMGFLVFRPMVRRVRQDMAALEDFNETLEERVAERSALAESRARELEHSERTLRDRTRVLRSILDSMGDGVLVVDAENRVQLINPAARRIFHIGPNEPLPATWSNAWLERRGVQLLSSDESTPYSAERFPIVRALSGEAIDRAEILVRSESEPQPIWLSITARPMIDEDGTAHGGVAVLRDVTGRKKVEKELLASESLYHSLVDNLPMCVIRKNRQGRFVFANDRFGALLGRAARDIVGRTDFDFYPPELAEKYQQDDHRVMRTGGVFEDVEEHVTPDGRTLFVEVRKLPVYNSHGEAVGTQAIFWDVTARVRGEQERQEMHARLLQSERLAAIGHMVAGVAHESRNALQQIQACTQMLDWQLNGQDHGEARSLLRDIQAAQDRLHRMFEDLRGFASPLRLDRRTCNLHDVLQDAWKSVTALANGRQTSLLENAGEVDLQCWADPFQLEQVFRNLLENACAACDGNVRIDVAYDNVRWRETPAVRIRLSDNGPGLTPEAKQHIFEPFFTTKTRGTGLGTAIARRIMEAHGGDITIADRSPPDSGTEVVMILPRGNT